MAALDYTAGLARLRVVLMDASLAIWADADLQAALRLALGEASLSAGLALTLSGLDGAGSTTLPGLLESALIIGAAGYATANRAGDRAEAFELVNESEAGNVRAAAWLSEWRAMLARVYPAEQTRTAGQKAAAAAPWSAWLDDFGEKGEED